MLVTDEGMVVVLQPATRVLLAVSIIALQLSRESYFVLPASTLMLVKPVQRSNAYLPKLVTDEGMLTLVRPVQSLNAPCPMLVTDEGMVMLVKPVQRENAEPPMLVTDEGMVMLVRPVHL